MAVLRRFRRVSCVMFLLACGLSSAQELEELLGELRTKNPAYQAAHNRWRAAQAEVDRSGAFQDPTVSVAVFAEEVETRVGPQKQRLGLSQTLPWPGKRRLAVEQARHLANEAEARMIALGFELEANFKSRYADLFYLGRSIAVTSDHLVLLRSLEEVVTQRYETGIARYSDLINMQMEIDTLAEQLASQRAAVSPIRAELNTILGRTSNRSIDIPEVLPEWLPPPGYDELIHDLRLTNPKLKRVKHQLAAARSGLALAGKKALPDFKLGLDWINTGSAPLAGLPQSGQDPLIVSVGVSLPIWRKKYRALDRIHQMRVETARNSEQQTNDGLQTALHTALFRWHDADRKLSLYRDQVIPKAEEALRVMTSGFQVGDHTYGELIDAEKDLLTFLLSKNEAESKRFQAMAALEAMIGKPRSQWVGGQR